MNTPTKISVIVRTRGDRLDTLTEVFLCLQAQKFNDFDVVVVAHDTNSAGLAALNSIILMQPDYLQEKTCLLNVEGGNRGKPLNFALNQIKGEYFCFLDDDDFVFSNWLLSFNEKIIALNSIAIIRANCAEQKFKHNGTYCHAIQNITQPFSGTYNRFEHILVNHTPFMCLCFPKQLIDEYNLKFDECLTTLEDWDFTLRATSIFPVVSTQDFVAIYRKWEGRETSYTLHKKDEWLSNRQYVLNKLNRSQLVLHPGYIDDFEALKK